jgi:alkanesulfonate monooxygenase SsuD/methylene tetrahydromethanopterin reductase-like flavin-dependent oxidoreductase (luciferase family)
MEFGLSHEFECPEGYPESQAFADAFELVDAAEAWGLDAVWLAELHVAPGRSVLSSPLTVASAIAARTRRIKIGTAVQILPLCHPLRLAEDTATIDQLSQGRLIFGAGRSGFPRAYEAYGIPYTESRERFAEVLEIVKRAWTEPSFSFDGRYYQFHDVRLVPKPFQRPHPPIRIAASSPETFEALGTAGDSIFVGARSGTVSQLGPLIDTYRRARRAAGHPGDGQVYLRLPIYVAETRELALSEPETSLMSFYRGFARRLGDTVGRSGVVHAQERAESALRLESITYAEVQRDKVAIGTPDMVVDRLRGLDAELGLAGLLLELNVGNAIPRPRVMNSLQLICREVMPSLVGHAAIA